MAAVAVRPRARPSWWVLAAVTLILTVVLISLSGRYGYFRDELYFLVCGRHLAWGYPDQPPGTPFLAVVMNAVGHGSLVVFRLPAVAVAAGTTLLTGLMAAELGGGRFAQALAAIATAASTYVLLSGHLLVTSTVDLIVWVTVSWLAIRMLRTGDRRLWVVIGVVVGLGLLNKQLPVVLVLGLVVGMLLTPTARPLLRGWCPWAGAAIAAAAWAPVLWWQAQHGWPQLTLASQIRDEYGTSTERINFFALQVLLFSLGATYLWVLGLVRLWRNDDWRPYRVLCWTWLVVLCFFVATAGQGYYPAGTYPALIAAGAVVTERHSYRLAVLVAVVVTSALTLPAALPILSPAELAASPWSTLGETQRESVGWPHLVDLVAEAYRTIPADQRDQATIYATNYGEAGAIDRFGPARGLPQAWSGHNGFGLWGPPPERTGPVVVVWEDGPPTGFFSGCHQFADVTSAVPNEESDRAAVFVCAAPIGGWQADWPRLTFLSA